MSHAMTIVPEAEVFHVSTVRGVTATVDETGKKIGGLVITLETGLWLDKTGGLINFSGEQVPILPWSKEGHS